MKLKHTLVVGSLVFLTTASFAFAQTAAPSENPAVSGHPWGQGHTGARGQFKQDNQAMHTDIQQNRQDFHASMSAARAQMQAQFQAERAAFKTKVSELKDQKKQTVVTDVTDKFTTINTNQTQRMTESLAKLSGILDKLSSKSASAKAAGKDTATVDSAIVSAKTALATAQTAVTAQAEKQYIPQITDDTALRQNVNTTFIQFKTDLTTTHQTIQSAKQAVLTVAQDLAKVTER